MADQVELLQSGLRASRGPASEATLEELVAAVRGNKDAIENISSDGGAVVTGINKVKEGAKMVFNTAGVAVKELSKFAKKQKEITDLTGYLSKYLGDFGDGLDAATNLVYDNFKAFRTLSQSGIYLQDETIKLTERYAAMGIDLETLNTNLRANAGAFAAISTSTKGAKLAMDGAALFAENMGSQLQAFGYDFAEMNETYFDYLNMNAYALQKGTMTMSQLETGSSSYAKYLRRLSDLTGQQADAIADQMKKANLNEGYKNFLSTMSEGERERANALVTAYGAAYGDAGREAAMSAVMGFAPMTEGAQQLSAVLPGFNQGLQGSIGMTKNFTGSIGDFQKGLVTDLTTRARANQDFVNANSQLAGGLILQGDELGNTFGGIIAGNNRLLKTLDDVDAIFKDPAETADGFNSGLRDADIAVKNMRQALTDVTEELISDGKFEDAVRNAGDAVNDFSSILVKAAKGTGTGADDLATGKSITDKTTDSLLSQGLEKALANWQVASGKGGVSTGQFSNMLRTGELNPGDAFSKTLEQAMSDVKSAGGGAGDASAQITKMMTNWANTQKTTLMVGLEKAIADGKVDTGGLSSSEYFDKFFKDNLPNLVDEYVAQNFKDAPQYAKGTLGGFGSLFQNFGKGTPAMLHGDEAVIPKDSAMGGMLSMMQGDLGNLKGMMKGKDGKMNIGGMIEAASNMAPKYEQYQKDNADKLKAEGRGMAKSLTGLSDEQLDKMEAQSVKSNNTVSSGSSINTGTSGLGPKLDELIRLNRDMLEELRNM